MWKTQQHSQHEVLRTPNLAHKKGSACLGGCPSLPWRPSGWDCAPKTGVRVWSPVGGRGPTCPSQRPGAAKEVNFVLVQPLSCVWLRPHGRQAPLSAVAWSSLRFMSVESVMLSYCLTLFCSVLLYLFFINRNKWIFFFLRVCLPGVNSCLCSGSGTVRPRTC